MNSDQYLFYILVSSLTIASPGPGVVLTVSNSIKYGFSYSILGILGISFGMLFIAILAGSGLGALLLASPKVFTIIKYLGAFYLAYLAWKLWNSRGIGFKEDSFYSKEGLSPKNRFKEAFVLTLSNPKPIIFFTALFPQFITTSSSYIQQFLILSSIFCILIIIIHLIYSFFSNYIGKILSKNNKSILINKISSVCFMIFSLLLIRSALS